MHLCGVVVISHEPPDFLLKCEEEGCALYVRSSDVVELERLAKVHRAETRKPLAS